MQINNKKQKKYLHTFMLKIHGNQVFVFNVIKSTIFKFVDSKKKKKKRMGTTWFNPIQF